jgi:prepilin signal peptidase PulO-like enzyme (type II secretory pathway)
MTLLLIFIFGLLIGSFLNALIWRLYKGKSIVKARSQCPHCNHILKTIDLIPVVSFILLKGRCRYCGKAISWQYPLVELTTATLFVLDFILKITAGSIPSGGQLLITLLQDFFFISILVVTFVSDVRWNLIFDKLMIAGMIAALIFIHFTNPYPLIPSLYLNLLLAATVGAGVFALQYILSKGRAVGSGDIFLGGLLGLILGWPAIIYALGLAYVVGALTALLLIALRKKDWKDTLPLGTFLSASGILLLLISN